MTAVLEQIEERIEEMAEARLIRLYPFCSVPEDYLPDDDDPAWPSKTGQAD